MERQIQNTYYQSIFCCVQVHVSWEHCGNYVGTLNYVETLNYVGTIMWEQ